MELGEFMKNKTIYLLVIAAILMVIFSGCSKNQSIEGEITKKPDIIIETESSVESKSPVETDTTKYEYAKMSDSFTIENHDVVVMIEYDERTNTFLCMINNKTDKNIDNMVIDIIYSSGLSVTKKVYTEIIPGENKITCPGTYEDPSRWRIEFSFKTDENIKAVENNSIIDIKHSGDVIPDDGIVIDGYRYAGKNQTYSLEKYGLKITAYYTSAYGGNFRLATENTTDKIIGGFDIGIKMMGVNRMDMLENYSIEPKDTDTYVLSSFGHIFDLWRPSIIVVKTGIDDTKDENTIINIKSILSKPEKVVVTEENIEVCTDWPSEMPKDIPCFQKGIIKRTTIYNIEPQQNIIISISEAIITDFDDYIEEIIKYGFTKMIVTEKEEYKQVILKRGDEDLQLEFYYKHNNFNISYFR